MSTSIEELKKEYTFNDSDDAEDGFFQSDISKDQNIDLIIEKSTCGVDESLLRDLESQFNPAYKEKQKRKKDENTLQPPDVNMEENIDMEGILNQEESENILDSSFVTSMTSDEFKNSRYGVMWTSFVLHIYLSLIVPITVIISPFVAILADRKFNLDLYRQKIYDAKDRYIRIISGLVYKFHARFGFRFLSDMLIEAITDFQAILADYLSSFDPPIMAPFKLFENTENQESAPV